VVKRHGFSPRKTSQGSLLKNVAPQLLYFQSFVGLPKLRFLHFLGKADLKRDAFCSTPVNLFT